MPFADSSANGHTRVLKPGVWAPIPTFFDDHEDLGKLPWIIPELTIRYGHFQVPCRAPGKGRYAASDLRIHG